MAIEVTPLGQKKPSGGELVRNGDNVIADNAQNVEDLIQEDRGRLAAIESKNTEQDGRLGTAENNLAALPNTYVPLSRGVLPSGTDLNTLTTSAHVGDYSMPSGNTYLNAPNLPTSAVLEVRRGSGNALSVVHRITAGNVMLWREAVDTAAGTWSGWVQAQTTTQAAAQDTRITGAESKNTAQDARLTDLETLGGLAPGDVSDATVRNIVANTSSTTSAEIAKQYAKRGEIVVSVTDFGAKGDWVSGSAGTNGGTNNLTAFNNAYAYAASITNYAVKLYIPAGKYRVTGTLNWYRSNSPRNDLVIEGADELSSVIVSDFFGAGLALVDILDPAGVTRASPTSIRNLGFASVTRTGGVNPVYLRIGGWGESGAENLRFGPSNNTQFSASSLQNVRMSKIGAFYGGHHFKYKATDGLTFATTTAGVLTSSAALFSAEDVGKVINILPPNTDTRIKYTISAYTSPTEVTVTGHSLLATTDAKGVFEAAEGSMVAGSAALTADAPCFQASDVGRTVYVRGARNGAWGAGNLRATITAYVSPTEVTLNTAAGLSVTRAPFATPVVDFYANPGAGLISADSNDVKIDLLHVENYGGVGVATTPCIFFHMDKMKVHGEQDPVDARASTAAMWLDDYAGTINGEFDGVATGDARVHVSSMNDTLTFEWLASRRMRGETLFRAETFTDPKGLVEIKTLSAQRATVSGDPYDMIADPNTQPRIVFNGLVTGLLGDNAAPRMYIGKDLYVTPQGVMVRGGSSTAGFDQVLSGPSGARVLFEDIATKKYSMGNTAGGGTSWTLTDETAGVVRLQLGTTGNFTPGTNNAQLFGALANRWANVFSQVFTMGSSGITNSTGTTSPEGVVTAPVGSEYINTSGAAGSIKWFKQSGTGNTGWVAKW